MTTAMREFSDAFERFDTKLIILTWMVDLAVTPLILGLLLHG